MKMNNENQTSSPRNRRSMKIKTGSPVKLRMTRKNNKGFTLVEMLIYMALLGIFLITLTDMFVAILNVKAESESTSAVEQDGRYILARLAYDVEKATAVTTPASLGGNGSTLVLTIDGTTHSYSINADNLQLVDNLGTYNLNSSESKISSINFHRLGNSGGKDTIKINFTIDSATQSNKGVESRTFNTTVGRRN